MEAGRELDAVVAEKVMGWKKTPVDNYPWQMLPPDATELKVKSCPRYSTDIAAAWQVVERFRRGSEQTGVAACVGIEICDGCEPDTTVWIYSPMIAHVEVTEQNAPLAICLAALKAIGVDDELASD